MQTFHPQLSNLAKLMILCFLLIFSPTQSYAEDAEFRWIANPEPLTGYKLYYKTGADSSPPYDGTGLNEGASPILIDKVTSFKITGLSPYQTYHFTLKAYDGTKESDYSAIITTPYTSTFPSPTINIITEN